MRNSSENVHGERKVKINKGRAILGALALTTTVIGLGMKPAAGILDNIREGRAEYAQLHKPGLAEKIKAGQTPDVLQDDPLALVEVEAGGTAFDAVKGIAKDGKIQELSSYVFDQTEGQPGQAAIPVDLVDLERSKLVASDQGGPLPTAAVK